VALTDPPGRQARLRAEYASLYPSLQPGIWVDADDLAEQMLTEHLLRPSPGFMLSSRIIPEEHFDFRGGEPPGLPRNARTRRSDREHSEGPADSPTRWSAPTEEDTPPPKIP
jgi:hypothetical protein